MHNGSDARLMEQLYTAVTERGYLDEEAVRNIGASLLMPPAWVYGRASQFQEFPVRKADLLVRICAGPCCAMRGSMELIESLRGELDGFRGVVRVEEAYGLPYWHLPIALEIAGRARRKKLFHGFQGDNITLLKKMILGEATHEQPAPVFQFRLKDFGVAGGKNFSLTSLQEETGLRSYMKKGGMTALETVQAEEKKGRRAIDQSALKDFHADAPLAQELDRLAEVPGERRLIIADAGSREVENGVSGMAADYAPYAVLEGLLCLGALAGADEAVIYLPWQDVKTQKVLEIALLDCEGKGFLQRTAVRIFKGPAFIPCRRDIGIAAVMEGELMGEKAAEARSDSPRVWDREALFVSAETLSKIPAIVGGGAALYKKVGGTALLSLTGDLARPRVLEADLGQPVGAIAARYVRSRKMKALHLHGSSGGPLPPARFGMSLGRKPSPGFGGSGAQVLVMNEENCMVRWAAYLAHLSAECCCGGCIPGRNAPGAIEQLLRQVTEGKANAGTLGQVSSLIELVRDTGLCTQAEMTLNPVALAMEYFQAEFEAHVEERNCPAGKCALGT